MVQFGVVGASGVVVNNAILLALVERLHVNPVLAAVVATESAIVSNFLLNDHWTFRDLHGSKPWARRLASYNVLTLGGLVLSVAVLTVLHYWAGVHYLVANLVGIAAGMAWNYGTNRYWTWSRLRAPRGRLNQVGVACRSDTETGALGPRTTGPGPPASRAECSANAY